MAERTQTGRKLAYGAAALVVAAIALGVWLWGGSDQEAASASTPATAAQGAPAGPPPAVVRYTEAREHTLRRTLMLPGSVQAQTASIVASTVAALVVEFPAKEGMRVKRGDVLARQRSTTLELTLESQKAALKEAQARWKLAESNLQRTQELFEGGVASRQQYDDAQSEYNAWVGRTDALKADIARIEDDIERTVIRAPFDGVVVAERTEIGQWLAIGAPVVELLKIDEVEIRVDVPERHFDALRAGSPASVTFESLPGLAVQGRVTAIIPQADPQARTFPVKVTVRNEHGRIGAGMLAQVAFSAGEVYRATVVPKDAIISRGQQKLLYRVNGDNTVEELSVETGAGAGLWIEVNGPVRPGDKVITRGNERLAPGMGVNATPIEYAVPS
jgi:RND family efflux transporter MFP subunit